MKPWLLFPKGKRLQLRCAAVFIVIGYPLMLALNGQPVMNFSMIFWVMLAGAIFWFTRANATPS